MALSTSIEAGKLRHRIQIMDPLASQDSFGGTQIDQATPVATVWASVEALSGRELYAAQQTVSEVTHKVTIRWMGGIKPKMNVWFDDRQFQIESILNPDERRKLLVLLCIERNSSAREFATSAT